MAVQTARCLNHPLHSDTLVRSHNPRSVELTETSVTTIRMESLIWSETMAAASARHEPLDLPSLGPLYNPSALWHAGCSISPHKPRSNRLFDKSDHRFFSKTVGRGRSE